MPTISTTARAAGIAALFAALLGTVLAAPADAREVVLRAPYAETVGGGCAQPSADKTTGRFTYESAPWPFTCFGSATFASKNPLWEKAHRQIATLHVSYARVVPLTIGGFKQADAQLVIPVVPSPRPISDCNATSLMTPEEQRSITPVTIIDRTVTLTCRPTAGQELAAAELRIWHQPGAAVEVDATLTSIVLQRL